MINLGLQRITRLLTPLFNVHPTLPWKAIHIAGTNGKGSVAALISTFLSHSGYKVGRFTSPHLIDRWDCITLNQRVVEKDKFLSVERHFRDKNVDEGVHASEFEILTATAFQLFADEKVEVAVVECGLGGRLDSTNVLRPQDVLVSVLTKVGLDHTEFLGDTLEAVAAEKAGIFKPEVPVVLDRSNEANVISVAEGRLKELGWGHDGQDGVSVSLEEQKGCFSEIDQLEKLPKHQMQNLYTAFTAYRQAISRLVDLKHAGSPSETVPLLQPQQLPALVAEAQASLPGRLQWLTPALPVEAWNRSPPSSLLPWTKVRVLLDGAHNAQSAQALAEVVNTRFRRLHPEILWVLSVKADKDVRKILSLLIQQGDGVITCSFGPVDRMPWVKSMDAEELASIARGFTNGHVESSPAGRVDDAIRKAIDIAEQSGPSYRQVCITGSLYLIGDVLRLHRDGAFQDNGHPHV